MQHYKMAKLPFVSVQKTSVTVVQDREKTKGMGLLEYQAMPSLHEVAHEVLLHNRDGHSVNTTGRVCYLNKNK
jgi:hypothetical protein